MKSNRPFWIIILVSAATLAAYTGYWFWGAQKLAAFAEEQLDGWRSEAVDVHYAEPAVTGFPGIIRVTFPSVAVTDSKQNWHWQGQQVELSAQPWKPLNFRGSLRGEQGLSLPLDGRMVDMVLSADRADVLTHFDLQGQLSGVELELVKLDGAAPMLDEHVRADYLYLNVDQLAAGGDLAASLRTKVTKLILPKAWDNPLGRGLKEFQAKINIVEPFPQSDLQDSLTRWQANGGRLDINWLKVEWGTLGLQGQGRLALDKDLRLDGKLDGQVAGLAETLEEFGARGLIEKKVARLAAAGARLFSFGKTADGRPAADIPIVLQQGNLLLGPLQLASIPPVFAPAKAPVRISPPPEEADRGPVPKELMPPAGDKITPVPTAPVVVEELGPPKAPAAQ
ncbi:DUF2125 domain-containing protein [Aestuariispira ectoiniformans]|uniref:DUF2125 domain-containing protein n=1 Tax=Aestuariispira ectoiniformans TaxID=2775080 RepID=UPI00223B14F3|nr:DUF2125 domain-containing protein [Aestuariispira ectoiniformans]